MKALVSWSSGNDSAWMAHTLRRRGDVELGAPHSLAVGTGVTIERDGYVFTNLTISNQSPNHQITRLPDC